MDDEGRDAAVRRAVRLYALLLNAYPAEFRREYGPLLRQAFRDLCREEARRAGAAGIAGTWLHVLPDLVATACRERSRATRPRTLLAPAVVVLGLLIAFADTSPTWEVVAASGLLGAAAPPPAWRWGLLVGVVIPAINVALLGSEGSMAGIPAALLGAWLGAWLGTLAGRRLQGHAPAA